jgi:alkylated DNA repair dioxygenase AlkB
LADFFDEHSAMALQLEFPGAPDVNHEALDLLQGLRYQPNVITQAQEEAITNHIRDLPFAEFDFHGYKGKRRVVSFGWRYEFAGGGQLRKADDIPEFLLALRIRAASFAKREPDYFQHALVTEYGPGAGIGWHRDKAVFGEVVGISLLSPCVLRFRRKTVAIAQGKQRRHMWERANLFAEPRSAYLLSGPSRSEWEHSILRVEFLRYSITFRHLL